MRLTVAPVAAIATLGAGIVALDAAGLPMAPARAVAGFVLAAFVPGAALLAAARPRFLAPSAAFVLAFPISLSILALTGIVLDRTSLGIRPAPLVVGSALVSIILLLVGARLEQKSRAAVVTDTRAVPERRTVAGQPHAARWDVNAEDQVQALRRPGHAKLTLFGRRLLVERIELEGWSLPKAAAAVGVSRRTATKWIDRYRIDGLTGLEDRSSAPRSTPRALPPEVIQRVIDARITLRVGSRRLERALGVPRSTIDAILRRHGLSRLGDVEGAPDVPVSYTRERPGQMLHVNATKLERISGPEGQPGIGSWRTHPAEPPHDVIHVAIDDATRVAYVSVRYDEIGRTSAAFLAETVGWFTGHGVRIRQVSTNDAAHYAGDRDFVDVMRSIGALHVVSGASEQAAGQSERFIQTMLNEWAYAQPYPDNAARLDALGPWVDRYNYDRPHPQLNGQTPMRVFLGNVRRDRS